MLPDKTHVVYRDLKRDSGFEGFRGFQEKGLRSSGIKNKAVAKSRFKFHALAICAALMTFAATGWGQSTIAGWDMSGQSSYGTSPLTATTAAANSTVGQLTKGSGFATGGTAAGRAWGYGTSMSAASTTSSSTAIGNNSFFTFTVKANSGYTLSLSAISTFDYRRSANGAQSGLLQYRINSGSFVDIATVSFTVATSGGGQIGSTDLSSISALQNLPSSSTVTFRCVLFNGSNSGTWYIFDRASTTANDFVVTGTVSAAAATPTITASGTLAAVNTTYGTASASPTSFTVSGANMGAGITVTPPAGFEVSTSSTFASGVGSNASPITVGSSGTISSTTVYVRLAATAAVASSPFSGNIVLSSSGATSVNVATASSTVTAKGLTITGLSAANKNWDGNTTVSVTGTPAYSGLVNSETFLVTGSVTWAFPDANVGSTKTLTRTGNYDAPSANYTVTQPTLTASINAVAPGAPTITEITAGNAQLSVAFTAPNSNGGAAISNYEYSTNGGTNWTTPSPAVTSSPLLITGLSNGATYNVQIRAVNSAGSGTATGTTQGTPVAPSSPTISVSPATFASALSTTYGTASSTVNFTVSGSTLSGNLMVTAPTGLEVSLTLGGSYSDSLNLTATSGTVTATTVYARLKATAAAGNYNSQSISVAGGGASTQSVATTATGNTVSQKVVTITGLGATGKVYDGTTSVTITGTATYGGLANGETHSVTDSVTWEFPDKSIGTGKVLTRSASYTAPNANYSLPVQPSLSADITAKELTGSFTANSKVFDNSTAATVATRAVSGKIGSEDVNHTGGTATFDNGNVGNDKTVTLASATLTGADAGNYTLTSVSTTTADITQGAAEITFAALPAGKKVGDAAFSAGATATLGATISYSSSNTAVATVNASSGLITLVAPGVTTITASVVGTANYNAATPVGQTLNVAAAGGSGTIAKWTFETSKPSATAASITAISAEEGTGTASGLHASSLTVWSNPAGNGSAESFSADRWAIGDYYQFQVSTTGRSGISLSFDATRSGSGPATAKIQYSIDGTTFTDLVSTVAIGTETWSSTTASINSSFSYDHSSVSNINNQSNVYFRIVATASPGATSGTFRVDNVAVTYSATPTPAITPSGTFAAVSTTYGSASAASATTATVTGGSLTADITATAPTGFQVSSDGTTYGTTATFTQTGGFANGTLYLRLAATAAAGAYNSQVVTLSSAGASNQTVAIANSTVTAASLAGGDITLTAVGDGSYTASGPVGSTFDYSYVGRSANGITTSYSSATAPTAAGFYTVTATATGNYSGSNTADYFVAGPVAVSDAITKPAGNPSLVLTLASLLANDVRITSAGAVATDGLSITGVTNGSGNSAQIDGGDILFTPGGSSPETFTYVLSYGSQTSIGTVTVTTESSAPTFSLQIVKVGTANFSAPNTSVTHDFIGVPSQTYLVEYTTDLENGPWTSAGNQSTGATGSFSVNFTKLGENVAVDWNRGMFFRARLVR